MRPPTSWFSQRLQSLAKDFLAGEGHGEVFEAMYLCYLDAWVAAEKGPERANQVWEQWTALCAEKTPEGQPVHNLAHYISDREVLVKTLQVFQHQFGSPLHWPVRLPRTRERDDVLTLFPEDL